MLTAHREIRGAVVASYQLMITFGILVSNIINYGVRNIEGSDASWVSCRTLRVISPRTE